MPSVLAVSYVGVVIFSWCFIFKNLFYMMVSVAAVRVRVRGLELYLPISLTAQRFFFWHWCNCSVFPLTKTATFLHFFLKAVALEINRDTRFSSPSCLYVCLCGGEAKTEACWSPFLLTFAHNLLLRWASLWAIFVLFSSLWAVFMIFSAALMFFSLHKKKNIYEEIISLWLLTTNNQVTL